MIVFMVGGSPGKWMKIHVLFCGNRLSGFLFAPVADIGEEWLFHAIPARNGRVALEEDPSPDRPPAMVKYVHTGAGFWDRLANPCPYR